MPMPRWWGQINKRIFNPIEMRRGKKPTLTHVGRSSGKEYVTPLDAYPVDDGYVFILVYGAQSDWVQNILAAGTATLREAGKTIELTNPRVLTTAEAGPALDTVRTLPGFLNIDEYLFMDVAS
jgi:deazaflavin-dependent oxidoreductase (nitroreductase family)